ncbi:hypothetical protein [Neobacillus kokaensis]|uniref:Uncharacterized protein n=1 Tax=Neobacillus kokaensis TaxID=2759023 RepID=A0ABQ3N263_9BACI|nr:hypothetical protein [Neobacillus kokaensis]GHH98777.1 hypothetical protein AM1BK_23200 [Neobacillus kokaensis]
MKKTKKKKEDGFFKEVIAEITSSFIFEVAWNIVMFIPRLLVRIIKEMW